MNLAQSIAVYATLCHELKIKFKCPGNTTSWDKLMDVADVDILCQLIEEGVLSDNPKYKNQAFNLNNGGKKKSQSETFLTIIYKDLIRWKYLWPKLAKYFKLEYEEPSDKEFLLADQFSNKEREWKEIANKYNLKWNELSRVSTFEFADKCIGM